MRADALRHFVWDARRQTKPSGSSSQRNSPWIITGHPRNIMSPLNMIWPFSHMDSFYWEKRLRQKSYLNHIKEPEGKLPKLHRFFFLLFTVKRKMEMWIMHSVISTSRVPFFWDTLSIYLFFHPFIHPSTHPPTYHLPIIYVYTCLSYPFIHHSIILSLYHLYLSVDLSSIYLAIFLFIIYASIYLSIIYLCIIYLSIHSSIILYLFIYL